MLWIKTLHIIFVTSWFAGLFYLPRIFVNLAEDNNSQTQQRLIGMAQRLYRFMTILAIFALGFGIWLWLGYGIGKGPGNGWLHAKLFLVILLIGYHHGCSVLLRKWQHQQNKRSTLWYRWFNEIPVVILALVVGLVIFKPF